MSSKSTNTGGAEPRALAAALAAPTPFGARVGSAMLKVADAHIDRWAPSAGLGKAQSKNASRAGSGSLRSLAFADRHATPWLKSGEDMVRTRSSGFAARNIAPVSWLLPRPAYQDELDWIAAAKLAADGTGAQLPMSMVAPEMSLTADVGTWSPSMPAQTVEARGVASLGQQISAAHSQQSSSLASSTSSESPSLGILAMLPKVISLSAKLSAPNKAAASSTVTSPSTSLARTSAIAALAPLLEGLVVAPPVASTADTQQLQASENLGTAMLPDVARVASVSPAARAVSLLALSASTGHSPSLAAGPTLHQPAGIGGGVAIENAIREYAPSAVFASASSGFADVTNNAVDAIVEPTRNSGMALSAIASAAPAALRHVAWSDRWLARMAGASPTALTAYDQSTGVPAAQTAARVAATAPEMSPLVAPSSEPRTSAAGAAGAPRTQRFDDGDNTPDSVLMAIAAARSQVAAGRTDAARARTVAKVAEPVIERAPMADRMLQLPPSTPGPGISAGLAASPLAMSLAGLVGSSAGDSGAGSQTFDVRAVMPTAMALSYLNAAPVDPRVMKTVMSANRPRVAANSTSRIGMLGSQIALDPISASTGDNIADISPALTPFAPRATSFSAAIAAGEMVGAAEILTAAGTPAMYASPASSSQASAFQASISQVSVGDSAEVRSAEVSRSGRPGDVGERARAFGHANEQASSDLAFDFVGPEAVLAAKVYGLSPREAAFAERLAASGSSNLGAMAANVERTFIAALTGQGAEGSDLSLLGDGGSAGLSGDVMPRGSSYVAASDGLLADNLPESFTELASNANLATEPAPVAATPLARASRAGRAPRGAFLWPAASVAALGLQAINPVGLNSDRASTVVALELLAARAVADLGVHTTMLAASGGSSAASPSLFGGAGFAGGMAGDASAAGLPMVSSFAQGGARPEPGQFTGGFDLLRGSSAADDELSDSRPTEESAFNVDGSVSAPANANADSAPGQPSQFLSASAQRSTRAFVPSFLELSEVSRRDLAPSAARAMAMAGRGADGSRRTARERAQLAWSVMPQVHVGTGTAAMGDVVGGRSAQSAWAGGFSEFAMLDASGGDAGEAGPAGQQLGEAEGGLPQSLSGLARRAGHTLKNYVDPVEHRQSGFATTASEQYRDSMGSNVGPMVSGFRAPTAAPELVRTGTFGPRFGGGETEIPGWFEAAAHRMLAERGAGANFSIADMALITSAPASHIAASSRSTTATSSSSSSAPSPRGSAPAAPDVEKLARDVYDQFLSMLDVARWRNHGER